MTLIMIALLAGLVLGQRFKVLVLLPTGAIVLLAAIGEAVLQVRELLPATGIGVLAITSLQIGYVAGLGIRHFLVATRASKLRTAFDRTSNPVNRGARSTVLGN